MTMWPVWATIGRPALRCVCKRRRASMIDRRHFLIGAGALLTASFVRRASAFSKKTGRPLILPAVQEPEETLYVYWQPDSEVANWRVSLGPDQPFAPPPPTWREHLRSLGHPLETDDEIERACRKYDLPVDDLDTASTASGGRTDGTTSPDLRPRRSTCSRASIWVTQDQRLGRLARLSSRSSGGLQATPTPGLNCTMT